MEEFYDLLSEFTYDGEGEVAWPENLHDFLSFVEDVEEFDQVKFKSCFHTHFTNPRKDGATTYLTIACTH